MRALLDPRLRANLAERYTSKCTLAQVTYSTSGSNERVRTGNSPIAGMVNIPCLLGPLIEIRPTDTDIETQAVTERLKTRQCKLSGYYPKAESLDLVGEGIEAIVDGEVFVVRGIDSDSAHYSTRLRVDVRKPNG